MKLPAITFFVKLSLVFAMFACQSPKEYEKPNVLFIFADDQTFESLGALTNGVVKTPNLDKLKESGVTFTHAFNQGTWSPAVCVASRGMMATGSYLWNAAKFNSEANPKSGKYVPEIMPEYHVESAEPVSYWSQMMSQAGYDTYFTGKWHVEAPVDSLFDVTGTVRGGMPNQSKQRYARTFIPGKPDTTWTPYDKSKGGFWKGGKHWSEILGDEAVSFVDQAKEDEDPFFMYLAFNAPHDPRQAPKKFVDMYSVEDIAIPENFLPEYPYNEEIINGRELRDERLAPFPRTPYAIQVNRQEYYALITHMDEQIGRILDALEASGKKDNTYIIFTADHGLALGDHGFVGKQNMYDRSMRVPFIIAGPDVPVNKEINDMIYLQDAMATALDVANAKVPDQVQFKSLKPIWEGEESGQEAVYGAYLGTQRMVRTEKYKMIIYPAINVVRLYDIQNDPEEMNDLATDKSKYKEVMNELFEKFKKLQVEVGDPLDISEHYERFFEL